METVRNGQKVWPYCKECECRLFYHRLWGVEYLAHSLKNNDTDSRGHRCKDVEGWWPITEEIKVFIRV